MCRSVTIRATLEAVDMGTDAEDRLIRLREVLRLSGLSRSAVYQKIKVGEFPAQVKTSVRSSAWVLSEVVAWKNARIAARDN
ncbi:MAG: helix-turn-helix transcriptional regulator [Telluria sp.]